MGTKKLKFLIFILICLAVGGIGSIFTSSSVSTWYTTLNQPSFNPPNWVFAPVWNILFILMGYAWYLIWQSKKTKQRRIAILIFILQLLLNILWSALFFGARNPLYALIEIFILWIVICITIIAFWKINKTAGILLLPYIAWVTFATILNFAYVLLN